jgi:twitching motility protein PilT
LSEHPRSEHLRDPELDRLIHELNRRAGTAEAAAPEDFASGDEAPAGAFEVRPGVAGEPAGGPPSLARSAAGAVAAGTLEAQAALPAAAGGSAAGPELAVLLADAVGLGASDVLLLSGLPPVFRVDGRLRRAESAPLDGEQIVRLFEPQLGGRERHDFETRGSADFSLRLAGGGAGWGDVGGIGDAGAAGDLGGAAAAAGGAGRGGGGGGAAGGPGWRFRANLHRQRGQPAAALRALPRDVPTLASLNLPPALAELVKPSRGLVLVCGPTGSGKSSTLAALIGEINRTRTAHIITIEDPVEYEHRPNRSLIEHVEVGRDARTFSEALRAALRQDPDVILVGEMRDLDTVATAVTAAETGHLVLATLHSNDSVQAVHRIVDVFPPAQQAQIRQQLALSVHAIVAQQLVPRADGRGRLPAVELMLASFAVRHHIRGDNLQKLYNEITLGKRFGMTSFEESFAQLVREGKIALEEARVRTSHPEELDARLRG